MLVLHTHVAPIRRSLFLALGLLGGCGGDNGGTTGSTSTGDGSTGASSSSGGVAPTSTGEGTTAVTTGSSMGGSSGVGESTAGSSGETTAATSGVSATGTTGTTDETTSGTTSGTSGTSEDTGLEPGCVELMQGTDPPVPSGWVKCGNDLPHRVEQVACEVHTTATPCVTMSPDNQCNSDAECKMQPLGSCNQFNDQLIFCGCVYGCETDADCAAGEVCRCGGPKLGAFTACTPSACADDGDCPGELCQFAQTYGEDCPFAVNDGHCTSPADACQSDSMCGTTGCLYVDEAWNCSNMVCGRPFVVEDAAVTAAATERDDWRGLVGVAAAPVELQPQLAAYWTQIGLYEHASIASFARFVLQLLAVGAPAALVTGAQQALADEVEHARVCFALASLYRGTGVGPGPLVQAGDAGATELADIVAAVIREACVGETLSALEAREAAAQAEHAGLRRVLGRIADDEQRHAELGWRFVQWALGLLDADGRARATSVLDAAIADAEAQAGRLADTDGTPGLRAFGVVDAPLRAAVWRRGLAELVRPAARALAA